MILGQSFVPRIHIAAVNGDGKVLHNTDLSATLSGAWLNNAIVLASGSLFILGKKGAAWLAHIQSDDRVLKEYTNNHNDKGGRPFQAMAPSDKENCIIIHDGKVTELTPDLAVEELIPLTANYYIVFYKYGNRIVGIDLGNKL